MVVAIVAAVRTSWKFDGNEKDSLYFWRNAMSNIWYSSEVVGTIIVQCLPVLRPLLRDMKTSMTSKRIADHPGDIKRRSKYVSHHHPFPHHPHLVCHFPQPLNFTPSLPLSHLPYPFRIRINQLRMPNDFVTTIGSKTTRKAHIYSDAHTFNDAKSEMYPDSWNGQGIFQKKEFELTTIEGSMRRQSENSPV
jgi:hypothetical protein